MEKNKTKNELKQFFPLILVQRSHVVSYKIKTVPFKFMEHLRKIVKTLDYFLVKFELIPIIKVKLASKKIRKF